MITFRPPALSRRRLLGAFCAAAASYGGPPGFSRALAATPTPRPSGTVTALTFDQGTILLAATDLWISADGGVNFAPLSKGPTPSVAALATHPDHAGQIFAATPKGLLQSKDAGLSWQAAGQGLPAAPIDAVAIAAHDPRTVYVAVRGDGLWQSKDGAMTWEFAMDRPLVDKVEVDIQAIASVASLSGMGGYWVYAGTTKGISKVPDCFCRWQTMESAASMGALAKGAKPAAVDAGLRLPALPAGSLVAHPSKPEVLFAGLPSGIWKTADLGASWALVNGNLAAPFLAINPTDPTHIVAADAGGAMLSSRDSGVTWSAPAAVQG